jgi:hypothetical protein
MEKKKVKLPKYEDVKKGIDELLLIENWDEFKINNSIDEFRSKFNSLFLDTLGYFPRIHARQYSNNLPISFYRLRKKDFNMNLGLISEYSYPPIHLANTTQRASLPGHPVLYCSPEPTTAIFETLNSYESVDLTADYFLSEWKFLPNCKLITTPFLFGNLDPESAYKAITDESYSNVEQNLQSNYSKSEIEGFKATLTLLSTLFIYDNTYAVSSYIADQHIYANDSLRSDFFIYPSVKTQQRSVNLAIHPNTVIEKMRLNNVYKLNVSCFDKIERKIEFDCNAIGVNKNSIISWVPVDKNDSNVTQKLSKVFGHERLTKQKNSL